MLVRNNIIMAVPKQAKAWKQLPLSDILMSKFSMYSKWSVVFRSLWKAWELIKHNAQFKSSDIILKDNVNCQCFSSIWWNVSHNHKPLALLQGCSAKNWCQKGIKTFGDILVEGKIKSWAGLATEFSLPASNFRTYSTLTEACKDVVFP